VLLQTYNPEHYALRAVVDGDDLAFCEQEQRFRRAFHYPPYTRMAQVVVSEAQRDRAEERMRRIAARVAEHPLARSLRVGGPAPAPIERLRGVYRFQLLLRTPSAGDLRRVLQQAVLPEAGRALRAGDEAARTNVGVRSSATTIDVDPYDLL
jgi:primosomal protein N' (replication factor Y)